jgi:hypothetical protein
MQARIHQLFHSHFLASCFPPYTSKAVRSPGSHRSVSANSPFCRVRLTPLPQILCSSDGFLTNRPLRFEWEKPLRPNQRHPRCEHMYHLPRRVGQDWWCCTMFHEKQQPFRCISIGMLPIRREFYVHFQLNTGLKQQDMQRALALENLSPH